MNSRFRQWTITARDALLDGRPVTIHARGRSMEGRIEDGDRVTVEPCVAAEVVRGDIVLAEVPGRRYWHLVLHEVLERKGDLFLVGSHHGRVDGWVTAAQIYGKVTGRR